MQTELECAYFAIRQGFCVYKKTGSMTCELLTAGHATEAEAWAEYLLIEEREALSIRNYE